MGRFLNPGNSAFQVALNSQIYVDKTGLLGYTNRVMDTNQAWICNSRPRRFGKSMTADMLTAYYGKGCDSEGMFEGLAIQKEKSFRKHLNQYDVIQIDVQWCIDPAGGAEHVVSYIKDAVIGELKAVYAEFFPDTETSLSAALSYIHAATGKKFIVIIDEWDVLIRDETANPVIQEEYINFLRSMFKGTEPTKFLHLAYLTGILPIKKLKTQSALNNFDEFTMLDASIFAPYIGFTEEEVKRLCTQYGRNFDEVKRWYDGYQLAGYPVYNPKAVVSAMLRGEFRSYWSNTGSYEAILPLINMDFDGLRSAIIEMLSGASVEVDVSSFQNDAVSFQNKDDVLTYLIHLGYLGYHHKTKTAFIPNEEIREEFESATRRKKWNELIAFQRESERLLEATLDLDAEAVARGIEKIHTDYASSIQYNNENSLSSVLTIAYLSAMQYYFKPIREMPTGRGFADFVFLPKAEYSDSYPALLVELKWNQSAKTAIQQIKERCYPSGLEAYAGDILLVGISYDKKTKQHQCVMETLKKNERK
ncbi:MAG: AAA family ATPase [Eubacteriales bacterium]|nr:AAA family ATPase [Eubacteriales bacterium]